MLHYTTRAGQPWSASEDAQLRVEAGNLLGIRNIAMAHLRSMGSIVARLEKLGFVVDTSSSDEDDWTYVDPCNTVEKVAMKIQIYDRFEEDLGAPLQHMLTLLQVGYTTCQVNFSRNGQRYTYKVSDEVAKTLKAGDQVVVPATIQGPDMSIGTVMSIDDEPQIDVTAPYEYKWIVCRVNREAYDDQIKRETEAAALIKKNERKRAQQQALKVLFGDASLEEVRAILSPKSREIPE